MLGLLSLSFCPYLGDSSTPNRSSVALTNAPIASEWQVILDFDPNLLRLLAARYIPDADGALGHNQQGYISVQFQRYTAQRVIYGLVTNNVELLEDGIRAFEYAFAYQNPDGSFPYNNPGAVSKPTAAEIASAMAGFYSDFGHSLLLLQSSEWFQKSQETANLRVRLNTLIKPANTSLTWLIAHHAALRDYHRQTTNLLFLDAAAYYLVGKSLNRSEAVLVGERFARAALQKQTNRGFFLEKGGYDSSYQAVSLHLALLIYTNLEPDAVSLQQALWMAIEKGTRWELSRILPTGEVSTEGNTRVYPGGEKSFGKEKGIDYTQVILALNYYANVSGDPLVQKVADQVLTFRRSMQT